MQSHLKNTSSLDSGFQSMPADITMIRLAIVFFSRHYIPQVSNLHTRRHENLHQQPFEVRR